MNRFKILAMIKEFPILHEILPDEHSWRNVQSISVRRIGGDILNLMPEWEHRSGTRCSYTDGQTIDFVCSIMEETISFHPNAVRQDSHTEYHDQHDGRSSSPGETVLEAIDRLGISDILYLIIRTNFHEEDGDRSWEYTVHKPSKDQTLEKSLNLARQRAAREVRAEVDF